MTEQNIQANPFLTGYVYIIHIYASVYIGKIASKINVTPKGVYLPISKLHSILAVANLLAHNNIS